MCGICGVVGFADDGASGRENIARMARRLVHRGPDDEGFLLDGAAALGFRRLSIIDLDGGHQPIHNEDGSAAIIFNGEVYNYRELTATLSSAGHVFRTRSDTEAVLHAYEEYGVDCVRHLRGMFAFAIWDRKRERLFVARDRLGIKPVYYHSDPHAFSFSSEIKALLELPWIAPDVDLGALDQYVLLRYVPGSKTMFDSIYRLPPGHWMTVDRSGVRIEKYWDLEFPEAGATPPKRTVEEFRSLLEESVRMRLVSEVPLGVFLSGGIDSSAILASMARVSDGAEIKTFSVGYDTGVAEAGGANEFDYARQVARAFHCRHYERRVTPGDFETFLPDLVWGLDEPLADPTCIPLYFLARDARDQVTVALSGEGADEILGGYGIYSKLLRIERLKARMPVLGRVAGSLSRFAPSERLRRRLQIASQPLDAGYRGVCRGFGAEAAERLMGRARRAHAAGELDRIFSTQRRDAVRSSPLSRLLHVDTKLWLPDDLLMKADKMTMASGLELRVPFLDHRMVEFAATLPDSQKIHGTSGKYILRQAMRGILPDRIIDRPKKGFPVPIAAWLRGPMYGFVREHLLARRSACAGYFEQRSIDVMLSEHLRAQADRSQELWTLLVFEFWHQRLVGGRAGRRAA